MIEHTLHDEDFIDPACPRCARHIEAMRAYAANPDPLTVEPSCCELACYEDPGCSCPGCDDRCASRDWSRVISLLCVVGMLLIAFAAGWGAHR